MARKVKKLVPIEFDDIHRGTSYCLPIVVRHNDGTLVDLTNCTVIFTLKAAQFDHDYDDDRALITKEFSPCTEPEKAGRFEIFLTSKELWLDPGQYFFDIVLMLNHSSKRILLGTTNIVGGPTNRNVRHDQDQTDFVTLETIDATIEGNGQISIEVPILSQPIDNLVKTAAGDPGYIFEALDDPVRNIRYRVYGPRISLVMSFQVPHDHTPHRVRFDRFFHNQSIPMPCPLHDGHIQITNRKVEFSLTKEMDCMYRMNCIQHNPSITYDGSFGQQKSTEPFYMGDRVQSGDLTITFVDGNDQIWLDAQHFIPDDHFGMEYWMVRVDWFNWVDPYEPDPEDPDVSTSFPDGCPVPPMDHDFWPFDIHYTQDTTEYAKTKAKVRTCAERDI